MGILSGWAGAPPRQQHASRARHCQTFRQRSRRIAKFATRSSADQKHGTKLATRGRCHTSGSMKANAQINSTTSCGNLGWNLRMSNCSGNMAQVPHPVPRDANNKYWRDLRSTSAPWRDSSRLVMLHLVLSLRASRLRLTHASTCACMCVHACV